MYVVFDSFIFPLLHLTNISAPLPDIIDSIYFYDNVRMLRSQVPLKISSPFETDAVTNIAREWPSSRMSDIMLLQLVVGKETISTLATTEVSPSFVGMDFHVAIQVVLCYLSFTTGALNSSLVAFISRLNFIPESYYLDFFISTKLPILEPEPISAPGLNLT